MKTLLLLLAFIGSVHAETFTARLTFYTGKKVAMSSNIKPQEGVTVAAAKNLKFGTKLIIPALKGIVGNGGEFVVQDRGPAVQSRKASGGKLPVIDIYVSSNAKIKNLASTKRFHTVKVEVKK